MSVWCGCHDKAAHANDPHPGPDWVLATSEDGHTRPQPPPPGPYERLDAALARLEAMADRTISRAKFRELAFQADLAYLTASGPDSNRVKAALVAAFGGLGYTVEGQS